MGRGRGEERQTSGVRKRRCWAREGWRVGGGGEWREGGRWRTADLGVARPAPREDVAYEERPAVGVDRSVELVCFVKQQRMLEEDGSRVEEERGTEVVVVAFEGDQILITCEGWGWGWGWGHG